MKKVFLFFVCLIVLMTACSAPKDEVLDSLGEFSSEEFFSHGEFQDYTFYGIYTYETIDFINNSYFKKISESDKGSLTNHIDNFEKWVALFREDSPKDELVVNYHFDSSIISDDDYLYIYDDPDYSEFEFGNYDIYFFDIETMTLYYFHNNI